MINTCWILEAVVSPGRFHLNRVKCVTCLYLEVGMLWCVGWLCFLPYVKDQILSRMLGKETTAKCAGSISAHLFRMHCTSMQTALGLWFPSFRAGLCHQQWMLFLEVVLLLIQQTILNFCCIGLVAPSGLDEAHITPSLLLMWKGQTLWSFVRQWVTWNSPWLIQNESQYPEV